MAQSLIIIGAALMIAGLLLISVGRVIDSNKATAERVAADEVLAMEGDILEVQKIILKSPPAASLYEKHNAMVRELNPKIDRWNAARGGKGEVKHWRGWEVPRGTAD